MPFIATVFLLPFDDSLFLIHKRKSTWSSFARRLAAFLHHTLPSELREQILRSRMPRLSRNPISRSEAFDISAWKLVEPIQTSGPREPIITFEWEQAAALIRKLQQRARKFGFNLHVQGDEVSGYRTSSRIPEAWRDTESRTTPCGLRSHTPQLLL